MLTPAASCSVTSLDAWRDHTVSITFRTVDPIGLTELTVDPEPNDNGRLLQLVDATIVRLIAYRRNFIDAEAEDARPLPVGLSLYRLDS